MLTVAVSVAAGVAALTSALPGLHSHRVALGVCFIALIAFANLRGVRESGRVFAVPTYLFVGAFSIMVGGGTLRDGSKAISSPCRPGPWKERFR